MLDNALTLVSHTRRQLLWQALIPANSPPTRTLHATPVPRLAGANSTSIVRRNAWRTTHGICAVVPSCWPALRPDPRLIVRHSLLVASGRLETLILLDVSCPVQGRPGPHTPPRASCLIQPFSVYRLVAAVSAAWRQWPPFGLACLKTFYAHATQLRRYHKAWQPTGMVCS